MKLLNLILITIQAPLDDALPDMEAMDAVQPWKRFFYKLKCFDASKKTVKDMVLFPRIRYFVKNIKRY